jgi:hypothetical protein
LVRAVSTPFGGFWMLGQNPESAPGRPTSSIHTFWGILDAGAESSIHAGPSNIQYPHLLGDSGRWGRIQNPCRAVQHPVSTPFGGFWTLGQNPVSMLGRPTSSIHTFWGILDAGAESSIHAGPSNIQYPHLLGDFGRWGRIQYPCWAVQHPVSTPFGGFWTLGQNPESAPGRPTSSIHTFWRILDAGAESRVRGAEYKDTGRRRIHRIQGFSKIQDPGRQNPNPPLQMPLTPWAGPRLACSPAVLSGSTAARRMRARRLARLQKSGWTCMTYM